MKKKYNVRIYNKQMGLAIMLELTGKPDGYQKFKWDVISGIPQTDFEIEFTF